MELKEYLEPDYEVVKFSPYDIVCSSNDEGEHDEGEIDLFGEEATTTDKPNNMLGFGGF
ncbi:MAG: hypothetical protein KBS79_04665 [Lachnospiraceae bacterium]|nr:hypothetical protein [Candidatus Minthocola equi]